MIFDIFEEFSDTPDDSFEAVSSLSLRIAKARAHQIDSAFKQSLKESAPFLAKIIDKTIVRRPWIARFIARFIKIEMEYYRDPCTLRDTYSFFLGRKKIGETIIYPINF